MNLLLVLTFIALAAGAAYLISGGSKTVVTTVRDGDTITTGDGKIVRLYGIDAPEHDQPYGREARESLNRLLYGKLVIVKPKDTDRYGRIIAQVFMDGTDASLYQLQVGSAWHYTAYDATSRYARAERGAREAMRGLWANPVPIPPWEWRASDNETHDSISSYI